MISVPTRGRSINAGQKATLGVRPHYFTPTGDEVGMLHGKVTLTERLGAETVVNITLRDGTNVIAALAEDQIYSLGQPVGLDFDPAKAHLFDELPSAENSAH